MLLRFFNPEDAAKAPDKKNDFAGSGGGKHKDCRAGAGEEKYLRCFDGNTTRRKVGGDYKIYYR